MGIRILAVILLAFAFSNNGIAAGLTAKSWLVSDYEGTIIKGENVDAQRSIASITKLLTAMIVLDANQDLDEQLTLSNRVGGRISGKISRRTLLDLSIVHSDNRASMTLCEHYPGGYDSCIFSINKKARSLGMIHTSISDPTGLDNRNTSTARDLIQLVRSARHYSMLVQASQTSKVEVKIKKKWFFFNNTNPMIGKKHNVIISKTGFTNPAGGCIVLLLSTEVGDRIVVVLGSKNTHTRIPEAEFIATFND